MVLKALSTAVLFVKLCFLYVFGNIAVHMPCLQKAIVKQMNRVASIVMPVDNYWHSLFSWSMMQTLWKYGQYEIHKSSKVGRIAPNPKLTFADLETSTQQETHLLDLVKGSRPLVVVFGSCTCPVVIANLDKMHSVQREFSDIADFVMIYVQEAHPDDGWMMKKNYEILRHKSIEERIEASKTLRSLLSEDITLYIDTIDNAASMAYSGCPNRILIIEGNVLTYQNGPGPTSYNFDDLRRSLQNLRQPM